MKVTEKDLAISKKLVGPTITAEDLTFVDSYIHDKLSIYMPVGGQCGYAVTPDHSHPAYMFVISYDSEATLCIGTETFESVPQSMLALSPYIEHHEIQNYYPPKYSALFIEPAFFENIFTLYSDQEPLFKAKIIHDKPAEIDRLIAAFIAEATHQHPSRESTLQALATMLTHEIIRSLLSHRIEPLALSDNLTVTSVVTFINTNYDRELMLDDLSKHSGLSKSHFSKLFHKEMQQTPMEYLKQVRMQNAKKMLLSQKLTITQVAQKCGYNSHAYFTKQFKELYGETPKTFMQRS